MVRDTLPKVWDWSRHPPGGSGGVGTPSRSSGRGQEAHPKVRETLPEDCETLPVVREVSGHHPGDSWGGRDTLPEVREWSGNPPGEQGGVGTPSRRTGRLGHTPGGPGGVGSHPQRSGRVSRPPHESPGWYPDTSLTTGRVSQSSGRVSRTFGCAS